MGRIPNVFHEATRTLDMEWSVMDSNGVTERRLVPPSRILCPDASKANAIGERQEGVDTYSVGETLKLFVHPTLSGYLQLWNLGTKGEPKSLNEEARVGSDGWRVIAGNEYELPGNLITLPPPCDRLHVSEPLSEVNGLNDILIAVVSRVPVRLEEEFQFVIREHHYIAPNSRGFTSVEEGRSRLGSLSESDWQWNYLEAKVVR